ncbi:MAG: sodium-dependent transporter [Succinivibrio sp.]|jgi:NSS family neurotransmitter:Na+ symporter|nr:sodium-dependent transporter [Succinivibrio sp.]
MATREHFSSHLGFMLIAAGCAIGLGNVWRFPFIVGQYGGAIFVLIYLGFLFALGVPLLTMELAVGRASRRSLAQSFEILEKPGSRLHVNKFWMILGNYVLMSFYSVVTGWMLFYCLKGFSGEFGTDATAAQSGQAFASMLGSPASMLMSMLAVVALGFGICAMGLRKGVERITKPMMLLLFLLLTFLACRSFFLDGFEQGISYYLAPNIEAFRQHSLTEILSAAMAQAFFTLSIGIGAIQIFGTYVDSSRTLLSESLSITVLDTVVALLSGFIIFPACFSYGVQPDQGPSLIFVTLVSVFSHMPGGMIWGGLFFMFMTFASLSTLVAVFENIISIWMETFTTSRRRAVLVNFFIILVISLPCLFGFNLLSDVHPMGGNSSFLDLEDFIISDNILPLGALFYVVFITWKNGWGFDNYCQEANRGEGPKIPLWCRPYFKYVLPVVIAVLVANCYVSVFGG